MIVEDSQRIAIRLSIEDARLVMEALAELPFKSVYRVIGELNRQANAYAPSAFGPGLAQRYLFSPADLALTLNALGHLPFNRVYRLVNDLNDQLRARVEGAGQDALEAT